ncbi:hypothetical protein N7492_007955 [Penicillium capsulatum]|uniref:Glucose-methanol-choline oxidoreductase N-terminal domain-containing protein n=1 Tax=Penicillium capsulatum TaxID=69766 RepID=A0A9W9HQP3_9EURO|nr:hypothetical protein N7492_007955 [Penicillium capsulatum]KAJ6105362.1 hypothetical protein N7512_008879 [Penicillium capsulatum]
MSGTHDYIIVGGGLTGCALAGRLAEKAPACRILIIEAGSNVADHPLTGAPLACFGAHGSPLDWAYTTVPQPHLNGRECYNSAGKALGGGTAINYGTWTRGNAADYDRWAEQVGDPSWSYQGLLPYFKRVETHFDANTDPAQHGRAGLIHNVSVSASSPNRRYPLRDPLRAAWERLGVKYNPDANAGSPMGLGELTENWREGKRQIASEVYGLSSRSNVDILTDTMVKRIVLEEREGKMVATGVETVDGRRFPATREVVVSASVYRTPQLLMLSGVGPADELEQHGIPQLVDAPEVGRNFHDHYAFNQWWKLRNPEKGLSIGTPHWSDPAYSLGLPCDWIVTTGAPREELQRALAKDGETDIENHPVLAPDVCHLEILVVYAPAGAPIAKVDVPMDGTHIATAVLGMAPTSHGRITLESADPTAAPRIDPNYYASEVDRAALRAGIRQVGQLLLDTPEGQDIVECETTHPDVSPLRSDATDEEIDARVRFGGNTFYHPAGSVAMGKVLDSNLRVLGVEGLRVADASILPVTVASHYQVLLYAVAEKAADLIVGS